MKFTIYLSLLILLIIPLSTLGQSETYSITKAPFSSSQYDEFGAVFYKDGVVFTSNRGKNAVASYSDAEGRGPLKIYYIDTTGKGRWIDSRLFSKDISSRLNDGPATFSKGGDTIYFTRNLRVEGNLNELTGYRNNLGIFSAVYNGKKWANIKEFRFNNEFYNLVTPFLSPDGSRLFFASDRPGGYGGLDLYYSVMKNGYWDDPVNMGAVINTSANESYPFMNEAGEFFFSSDGRNGLGGKDIYVTKSNTSGWYPPISLDPPVNSESDDFGIVTDQLMTKGYFTSGRDKSIDIYQFKSNSFQFWFSEPQKENEYCLTISDTGSIQVDTLRFRYAWDFGDGSKLYGKTVSHCFAGNGKYKINLDLIDRRTGNLFFRKLSYDIEIFNIDQPFITSPDIAIMGEYIDFDALKSYCPGNIITGYFWDFGDGAYGVGEKVSHKFLKAGDIIVRLGLSLKSETTGKIFKRVVSKKIKVLNNNQERASYLLKTPSLKQNLTDIRQIANMKVNGLYSAEVDLLKESVFQVVLLTSKSRIPLNSGTFKNLPSKYTVREIFEPEAGHYSYIVDQQMSLMAAFPAYNEVVSYGFKSALVRIWVLRDPAEKDLYKIMKNYSLLTDINFDAANRLTTSAYIMLDQIVTLMNKYPDLKLEIGLHTDNQGIPANNQASSLLRAQIIVNHLVTRGINIKRLTARGYGETRPVASNIYATDRRLNRRIDFSIIN